MVIAVIVVLSLIILHVKYKNREVDLQNYSFSETHDINFTLNDLEKKNINDELLRLCINDEKYYGFTDKKSAKIDLYQAYSVVNLLSVIPNSDMIFLQERLSFLSSVNIEQFDFLNLMYYIDISQKLNINLNYLSVNNALRKYYDHDENLFYVDDEKNSINIKIVATAMVKNILKENLSDELFAPELGIKKAYNEYDFLTQNDVTLYNSGGDILYCISIYEMNNIIDKSDLMGWYEYWKAIYESTEINSQVCAVQYAEYLNVAKVFESNYSMEKLQKYYDSLSVASIERFDELNILYNFMKNIDVSRNKEVLSMLSDKIIEATEKDNFIVSNIDVKSTAFGVMLAKKSGFEINEDKVNNYMIDNYKEVFSSEQIYERTLNLYYNLILDQLINGYEQEYDCTYFQSQVDEILELLDYSSRSMAADIISTRRIVEIVSDLQIFDVDIKLKYGQKKKIQKAIEEAVKINDIKNSVLINDLYIIDSILSLGVVSEKNVMNIYDALSTDGGTCAIIEDEVIADINTTYQFYVSLGRMNQYEYLNQQQKFVEYLRIKEGIYKLDNRNSYFDFVTVVYGNTISSAQIGGDKFD